MPRFYEQQQSLTESSQSNLSLMRPKQMMVFSAIQQKLAIGHLLKILSGNPIKTRTEAMAMEAIVRTMTHSPRLKLNPQSNTFHRHVPMAVTRP